MSEHMCLRQRGRCWQGSTSAPSITRSGKASNTRGSVQSGASPQVGYLQTPTANFEEYFLRARVVDGKGPDAAVRAEGSERSVEGRDRNRSCECDSSAVHHALLRYALIK